MLLGLAADAYLVPQQTFFWHGCVARLSKALLPMASRYVSKTMPPVGCWGREGLGLWPELLEFSAIYDVRDIN